ncbi:MAG TPA: folate-binding protein [Candidatus Angelobacter sp.]
MSLTALHPWLATDNARVGVYNGVETALHFGDPTVELAALRTGCGLFAMAWRGKINVSGKDRTRWLHNMVTNNVRDLPVNHGNYNFVLNAQGRILGDMYIFNRGESLILDTDATQVEALVNTMKRFIIMDKVELTPMGEDLISLGVCGPKAAAVLAKAGINAAGMAPLEIGNLTFESFPITLIAGPAKKSVWFEIWFDQAKAQDIWSRLTEAGAQPVGVDALETWRVIRGIPHYGKDIRDRDLPQETGQADALNFTKGCYIGQEIVERIRSRGHVHRTFTGFEFPGVVPAMDGGEPDRRAPAEVTSVARVPSPVGEKNIGLGYVRREVMAAESEVDLNGVVARVVELPFEI